MTIQRMDNVAIVVDDLDAAVAFFTELGMELEGKGQVEGLFADRTVGLDGVRTDIAMIRTPDGHSKLELTEYHTPAAVGAEPENPPPNTLGLHRVMFAVDDINDTVARLRAHGAELLGEVAQYESSYLLCYLRGPAGKVAALELGAGSGTEGVDSFPYGGRLAEAGDAVLGDHEEETRFGARRRNVRTPDGRSVVRRCHPIDRTRPIVCKLQTTTAAVAVRRCDFAKRGPPSGPNGPLQAASQQKRIPGEQQPRPGQRRYGV